MTSVAVVGWAVGALDLITMLISCAAALECAVGRVGQMDRRFHRASIRLGYALASATCILSVFPVAEWLSLSVLRLSALSIALHLALTWQDWRNGVPFYALRGDVLTGLEPSRIPRDERR